MQKKLICPLLFLLYWIPIQAQPKSGGTEFFVGYFASTFSNPTFAQNMGSSRLSGGTGWTAGLRMHFGFEPAGPKIAVLHANYFVSPFTVSDAGSTLNTKSVSHIGGEIGLALMALPKTLPYFSPFVGMGYQGGALRLNKDSNSSTTSSATRPNTSTTTTVAETSLGMSAPVWRVGLHFQIKQVILQAEYKQSFGGNAERKFNQLSITLGWQPWQFQ